MHIARRLAFALAVAAAMMMPAHADATNELTGTFPVHGVALAIPAPGTVIATLDAVPGTYAAQTRRFRTAARLRPGESFDAYLDRRSGRLDDVNAAAAFVPGMPNQLVTHVFQQGDVLPAYRFETQDGREFRFAGLRGKVVLLSFMYTRCPDVAICPAISGKFAYLQHHLDPRRFQLVELTLDPLGDSPAALAAYAGHYGTDPARWSLITGEPAQIKNVLDAFTLDPLETNPGQIIHGDKLVITDQAGKIADIIPTSGWSPDDVIATAENVAGSASNPLRRFELATIAGVIAFCGGSVSTEIVVLDSAVFIIGVAVLGGLLIWITKRIIIDERF
jgi:protein SCO1/2